MSPTQAWYIVGVLALAYTFSFIDRSILGLMVGPIRADLDINDTQFSPAARAGVWRCSTRCSGSPSPGSPTPPIAAT